GVAGRGWSRRRTARSRGTARGSPRRRSPSPPRWGRPGPSPGPTPSWRRPRWEMQGSLGEVVDELLRLVGAQTADLAGRGDADLLHDLGGLDLADARQGLEEGGDAQAADDLVRLGLLQHLLNLLAAVAGAVLQAGLDGRALTTRLGGLLQGIGPLLRGEGRESHCSYLFCCW